MDRNRRQQEEPNGWETFANIAMGVTAAAVGIGAIIGAISELSTEAEKPHSSLRIREVSSSSEDESESQYQRSITYPTQQRQNAARNEVSLSSSWRPPITNLNGLLNDIYVRYIALKDDEFDEHYSVFQTIFGRLQEMMKEVDPYFRRFSSTVQFAGSHYDGLRINKPDEIDIDIVIKLPISMAEDNLQPAKSDIILEHKTPAYVQLKMGEQFLKIPHNTKDWEINITAYKWLDEKKKYLLRSKFLDWFKGVVDRALNCFGKNQHGLHFSPVNGVYHTIRTSGGGPAVTLIIQNEKGFKLNVDLVPALKFPEDRWPICRGYRKIPSGCEKGYFMVVPKEDRATDQQLDKDRCWRLALHLQERELMHDTNHLRQAIRYMKKLRDSEGMVHIESYYIKTLFYHEVMQQPDSTFWFTNATKLFIMMTKKLEVALRDGNIPYFWNKDFNLLWNVHRSTLTGYANRLKEFIRILETPVLYKSVPRYMLTGLELFEYES